MTKTERAEYNRVYWQKNKERLGPAGRARIKQWQLDNPERVLEQTRKFKAEHPEYQSEYMKRYYRDNKENFAEYHRQYRTDNIVAMTAYGKAWYKRNRQRVKSAVAQWQTDNPEKVREYSNKKRVQKAQSGGSHTIEQWQQVMAEASFRCMSCNCIDHLTRDHITPLSFGGSDHISNIQPLCRACNSRKHTASTDYRDMSMRYQDGQ